MNRINLLSNTRETLTWGKNASTLLFAAVLIICSVAVGCSSEKPKPVTSNIQIPVAQPETQPMTPAPIAQAEPKPAHKKPVVRKKPATVNYADKTYGVTFEYPRRYAIETGDAATQLIMSNPIPMNFVQPGGVALAAIELPETNYVNTDFSSAFFNVSVHKTLTADQCGEFAVPQPKVVTNSEQNTPSSERQNDMAQAEAKTEVATQGSTSKSEPVSGTEPLTSSKPAADSGKLLIGDMELRATEAVSGEGTRQSDSKYFHTYQNGACYEFALNVTTDASEEGLVKHVDRDKVFNRLEQILSTVKITAIAPEVKAESQPPAETPAQ